jgi:5-(carboxyamino)imidazole ribonucleotide synthase
VHLYAKRERPRRKVGHVTVAGEALVPVRNVATASAAFLATGTWPDGYQVHDRGRETA